MKTSNSVAVVSFLLLPLCFALRRPRAHPDEIRQLPGFHYRINFKQYSGYLNASSGKYLHYWFVESQKNPASDPVVLWMNGGPGCSSMDSLLTELGPFHVKTDDLTLRKNPFSWNKVANVIFLDTPAGVGFSYSDSQQYSTDDDSVSMDNYLAIQDFFIKFPQFKRNDFYVTGVSYASVYVATLGVRLLNTSCDINFKGFAVGNGYLDAAMLTNSAVFFAYYHGLLSNSFWNNELVKNCCNGTASQESCNFADPPSSACSDAVSKVEQTVRNSGLNFYNLYSDCLPDAEVVDRRNMTLVPQENHLPELKGSAPCIDYRNVSLWINQNSVRTALHIPDFLPPWSPCNLEVLGTYRPLYNTSAPQVLELVHNGKQGLVYNGDVDMVCNFLGDSWFVDSLSLNVVSEYKVWRYNNRVAGFFQQYEGDLTFLTIKGAGHRAPQDKPGPAFKMISSFLGNKTYD